MAGDQDSIRLRERKASWLRKGLSYGQSIVLHETSRKRIELLPWYIRHKSGETELSIRLINVTKSKGTEKIHKFCFNQTAGEALLQNLREHVEIAAQNQDGSFILLPISDGDADISNLDTCRVTAAVASLLRRKDIVQHLAVEDLGTEIVGLVRGAIRVQQLRQAVCELRTRLDSGIANEKVYQDWCKQHSWAFGLGYLSADDVRNITASDRLDLILPCVLTEFRDIVELKRPNAKVLHRDKVHRNYYFSSEVSQAIGQCHRYLEVFFECAQHGLQDHREILAHNPRVTVVIGRSTDWDNDEAKAFHGLSRRLIDIDIITYDHLLAQGERLIQILSSEPEVEMEAEDLPF